MLGATQKSTYSTLYADTSDRVARLTNLIHPNGIKISEDERATIRLAEPFAALVPEPTSLDVGGSSTSDWVGLTGLEPVTSALSGRRSNRLSYRPAWAGTPSDNTTDSGATRSNRVHPWVGPDRFTWNGPGRHHNHGRSALTFQPDSVFCP